MVLKFIKNFKYIKVIEANDTELKQLIKLTTGSRYNYGSKSYEVCAFFQSYKLITAGFWTSILGLKEIGYDVKIVNLSEFLTHFNIDGYKKWIVKRIINESEDVKKRLLKDIVLYDKSKIELHKKTIRTTTHLINSGIVFNESELKSLNGIDKESFKKIAISKILKFVEDDKKDNLKNIVLSFKKCLTDNYYEHIRTQISYLKEKKFDIKKEDFSQFFRKIDKQYISDWIGKQDLIFEPYKYQIEAVYNGLKTRHCRVLLDTSAGKSFIIYLYSLYLLKEVFHTNKKKILILVPRTLLVEQLPDDFLGYSDENYIKCANVEGGYVVGDNDDANVFVGNINTVFTQDRTWFEQFGAIIMDEGHAIRNQMTQAVMNVMFQNKYCDFIFSMSGTFEDLKSGSTDYDEYSAVTETAYLGSMMMKVYLEDLKKYGTVVPSRVIAIQFNAGEELSYNYYNHPDCQPVNGRYLFEKSYTQGIKAYRQVPIKIASEIEHNQVMLFTTKAYLRRCAKDCEEYFKENNIDKKVFIIDGDVLKKDRKIIIDYINKHDNSILFAMYQIMSTGVSIKSLAVIHLADSAKKFGRVRQSIGRVFRLHPSKEEAVIYDYHIYYKKKIKFKENDPENPWGGGSSNSYSNHFIEREHIYKMREIPLELLKISIDSKSEFMDEIPRVYRPKKVKKIK